MNQVTVNCFAFGLAIGLSMSGGAALAQGVPVIDVSHPRQVPDKGTGAFGCAGGGS